MEEGSLCKGCRTWEEEIYWKHFSSIHFFLFLPHDFHHHLVLPGKFVENMMTKLPNKVSLIGPSATKWDVELKKTDKVEFVGDGWKHFVRAYDLKHNNLLMFKYNQNLTMEVLIFDPDSFCEEEKSYFVKKCSHKKPESEKSYFVKQCSHKKPGIERGKRWKVSEAFITGAVEDELNDASDHNHTEVVVKKKSMNDVCEEPETRKNPPRTARKGLPAFAARRGRGGRKRLFGPSRSRSNLEAQPEKEPEENGVVHDVAEQDPKEKEAAKEQGLVLEKVQNTSGNGGTVTGKDHSYKSAESKEKEAQGNGGLHNGVEQEPEENGAVKGQMHVSEREQDTPEHGGGNGLGTTHSHKSTAKKVTPRNQTPAKSSRKRRRVQTDTAEEYAKEYISNRRPVTEIEKDNALKRALKDHTDDKSFVCVMRPTAVYRRFFMTVPVEWMFRHQLCNNQQVVLRIGEKTWTVFFYPNGKKGGGLAGFGWRRFAVDNLLEEFDVCLFQLASEKLDDLVVMDVQIFRVIPDAGPPTPTTRSISK